MTADHPTREERYAAVLAALNVTGWRQESDHGCDGTEEVCAVTCPVPVQVEVSREEMAAALVAADPAPAQPACRCQIIGWTRDPAEPHIPAQPEWEQADDCPVHPLTPAQPDAALSEAADELETQCVGWMCQSCGADNFGPDRRAIEFLRARAAQPVPAPTCTCGAVEVGDMAQHLRPCPLAQPVPAPEVSRGVTEVNIIQRIVNAWDCCATCAGGVLAQHDREVKAEALREAADDLCLDEHGWAGDYGTIRWLRDRADRLVRDALGGERGEGA